MVRSTRRGVETWHGRDGVTLADERARQQGTQTSTYTGAPVLDPTDERGWETECCRMARATAPIPAPPDPADPGCPLTGRFSNRPFGVKRRPGDGNGARPDRSERRFRMFIATSSFKVLRRSLGSGQYVSIK